MQIKVECSKCGKSYEKNASSKQQPHICYHCALESLTKGTPPEEGDFNTASIISGEMSDEERALLQQDLNSVDRAACESDPLDNPWDCSEDDYLHEDE